MYSRDARDIISSLRGSPGTPVATDASSDKGKHTRITGKDLLQSSILMRPDTEAVFYQFVSALYDRIRTIKAGSKTHRFLRRLHSRGQLIRCYTQNIDGLEAREGLSTELTEETVTAVEGSDERCMVVQLHGDVGSVRCTICPYESKWSKQGLAAAREGQVVECPQCAQASQDRVRRGKRPSKAGVLRPGILLYGEEHRQPSLLKRSVEDDRRRKPTMLLVMATSLQVPGCQQMVKDFAQAVHGNRGMVVFVNNRPPNWSVWENHIDRHISIDVDEWADVIQGHWDSTGGVPSSISSTEGRALVNQEAVVGDPSTGNMTAGRSDGYEDRWWTALKHVF